MPAAVAIPAIIGAAGVGTSIAGGILGSNAAKDAAATQAAAASDAASKTLEGTKYSSDNMLKAAQQANSLQELMFLLGYSQQQPYQEVGQGALMTLKDLMQPTGYLAEGAPDFKFNVGEVAQDPGYDFALKEGQKALERSAAAKGTLLSGATAKGLLRYGNDYATTKTNDVYNRNLSTYNTNLNAGNMNRTNLFNRLSSLAGTGQQAANANANAGNQLGANMANTITNTAGNIANLNMSGINNANNMNTAAANANASGYVGSANAWGSALGNIANAGMDYLTMQQLLKNNTQNTALGAVDPNKTISL